MLIEKVVEDFKGVCIYTQGFVQDIDFELTI